MPKRITTPLDLGQITELKAGDFVLLSGIVYTARDAAHQRFSEYLNAGKDLPIPLKNQILYYLGPTPTPPGKVIGSAGPTSACRMDAFTPALLELGLKGMIGKGIRNEAVRQALIAHQAVYFAATGGVSALLAQTVKKAELIAFEDLGTEAVRLLEVEDMPLTVVMDCEGNSLYRLGPEAYLRSLQG